MRIVGVPSLCFIILFLALVDCDSKGFAGLRKPPVLDFIGLVNRHGYPAEKHQVITSDGYRLTIHRVPGSPSSPPRLGKPIIFIQHGILEASDQFVIAGPDNDLVFILADAGYDIWLGNSRGNTYSRSHVKLSPDHDFEFWQFSQHEMALYDVSKEIDYILQLTGQRSVVYIGHSMGTTIGMILLATKPEYNDKIQLVINLATIGNWKRPTNFMKFLKDNGHLIMNFLGIAKMEEVLPRTSVISKIIRDSCGSSNYFPNSCRNLLQFISGSEELDIGLLTEVFYYFPAGASRQTLGHYYQNMKAGKFQMYDYGCTGNLARYHQKTPPIYNLKNIVTPVVMIYGNTDAVANPEDTFDLLNRLRYARAESVPHNKFGHLAFLWGKDLKKLLHNRMKQIIETSLRYEKFSVLNKL